MDSKVFLLIKKKGKYEELKAKENRERKKRRQKNIRGYAFSPFLKQRFITSHIMRCDNCSLAKIQRQHAGQ